MQSKRQTRLYAYFGINKYYTTSNDTARSFLLKLPGFIIFIITLSMKRRSLLIGLFLFWTTSLTAQSSNPALNYSRLSRNDWSSILKGQQPLMTKRQDETEVRGTPFLYESYHPGSLIISDSFLVDDDFKFKLNLEDNEIWIDRGKDQELVLIDKRITGLHLTVDQKMHTFTLHVLPGDKKGSLKYVEVLFQGPHYTLIKNTVKKFEPANAVNKGVAIIGKSYDSYLTTEEFYIRFGQSPFKRISLKRAEIYRANLQLINTNRDSINAFCIQHHFTSLLSEADAIKLVSFLDSLD
jgi:hypothetical protein